CCACAGRLHAGALYQRRLWLWYRHGGLVATGLDWVSAADVLIVAQSRLSTRENKENPIMSASLLEVSAVAKAFGGNRVLQDVTLDIKPGEIVGLLGPNGSGKSTLLNIITGFESLDSGQIIYQGNQIANLKTHKIVEQGIARTFQLPSMPEKMS